MHPNVPAHLNLPEVDGFPDDLVVLWQLLPGRQDHEDGGDLSARTVPVLPRQLPQFDHHTGQLGRVWVDRRNTGTLLMLGTERDTGGERLANVE